MMVSKSNWKDGARMYMPHIYNIAFTQSQNADFSINASEDVWIHFCNNEHRNGLLDRIGDPSLLEEITNYTIKYCHDNGKSISPKAA